MEVPFVSSDKFVVFKHNNINKLDNWKKYTKK